MDQPPGVLALTTDPVPIAVEVVGIRVGHVPEHSELPIGNVSTVEVRRRRGYAVVGIRRRDFPPAGGGGGGGGRAFDRQAKPRTGCSSIALRATPVCPWKKSQKATPTTRALAQTLEALRAALICFRRVAVAPFVQSGDGASAIIVREPLRRTR